MASNPSVHEVLNNFDTLSEILLLLPPEETYKLILVSKRWLQIISSPFFRHAYLTKWKPNFHLIGFIICNTTYVGKREGVRRPRSESSMPLLSTSSLGDEVEASGVLKKLGYYIDSSNGVLLCGRHPKGYYLWDPATRKHHKIPRHRVHFEEVVMSLITEDCPEGFSYKVVRGECVSYAAQSRKVRVETYSSKTTTWSYSELTCHEAISLTPWNAGRVIQGVVYWYATGGKVAIYDTNDEERRINVIKLPKTYNYDEQVLGESGDGCLQYGWSNKAVMEIWKLEKVSDDVLEWTIQFKVNFKAMWRMNPVESARFRTKTKETQLLAFFNQNSDSVFIRCDSHIFVFDTKTQRVDEVQYQGRGSSFVWDYCKVLPYFQPSWPCSSSSLLEEENM